MFVLGIAGMKSLIFEIVEHQIWYLDGRTVEPCGPNNPCAEGSSRETVGNCLAVGMDLNSPLYIYEGVRLIETYNNPPINPILTYASDVGVI